MGKHGSHVELVRLPHPGEKEAWDQQAGAASEETGKSAPDSRPALSHSSPHLQPTEAQNTSFEYQSGATQAEPGNPLRALRTRGEAGPPPARQAHCCTGIGTSGPDRRHSPHKAALTRRLFLLPYVYPICICLYFNF